MKIEEFLSKCKISNLERKLCLSVYSGIEKDEESWSKELNGNVVFEFLKPKNNKDKVEEIKAKIEEKKNKRK